MTVAPCRGVFSAFHRVNSGVHRRLVDAAGCSGSNSIFPPGPCCACQPSPHQPPLSLPLSPPQEPGASLAFLHAAQERDTDLYRPFPALPAEPSFLRAPQPFLPEPRTWSVGHLANSWEATSLDSDTSLLSSPCLWPAWQAGARIFCALCSEVRVGGVGRPRW